MWSQGAAHELVVADAKENCFQLPTQTLQAAGWAHQRFQVGFPEKKARFTKDISRNGCEILWYSRKPSLDQIDSIPPIHVEFRLTVHSGQMAKKSGTLEFPGIYIYKHVLTILNQYQFSI